MKRKRPQASDPIEVAARALRRRDRSRRDVDSRLAQAGVDDAARAETLDTLERIGYLDERRFAQGRAAALAARGYGDAAIRASLEQEGVDGDAVEEALAALESEADRAAALVARHGASARTGAQLTRKGFAPEVVEDAIGAGGGSVV
jgi:regulatory protein